MSDSAPTAEPVCSREQIREAAVWLTMLRSPDRTERTERGFQRWLTASGTNRAAFEIMSGVWERAGALPRGPFPHLSRWQRAGFRQGFLRAGAIFAAVALAGVIGVLLPRGAVKVDTEVGEQRLVVLDDGSRVHMNTDTRIVVDYDDAQRHVELLRGEALFEVARKESTRPFVVTAEQQRIVALGTSFVVRRDSDRISVTLVEGRVKVMHEEAQRREAAEEAAGSASPSAGGILLSPGERLVLGGVTPPTLDRPEVDKLVAWRNGHVVFEDVPLSRAIAEMNRYSRIRVELADPRFASIPINGIFRGGDSESFARAVSTAYSLELDEKASDALILGGHRFRPRGAASNPN